MGNIERLSKDELEKIIKEMKENGKYQEYQDMISDDFEEHMVVYVLDPDEMAALAYKLGTTPYAMKDYYDWHEMNLLMEEEDGIDG